MRRRLIIAGLLVVGIAGVVSFGYFQRQRHFARRTACVGSLIRINLAKQAYAKEHGLADGAFIPKEVIWREIGREERCFSGGRYSVNPVGIPPSCSYTGAVRWDGRLWVHNYFSSGPSLTNGLSQ